MLSSPDAIRRISSELKELAESVKQRKSLKKNVIEGLKLRSMLPWPYLVLTLLAIVALALSSDIEAWICAVLLSITAFGNFATVVWDSCKRQEEIYERLEWCIEGLEDAGMEYTDHDCLQLEEFYKLLRNCKTASIMNSLSHSVSYVYRSDNGKIDRPLPIPTALLATGDEIALWPGQESPANVECQKDCCCSLIIGEVLCLAHIRECRSYQDDTECPHRFLVTESPIMKELKKCLPIYPHYDKDDPGELNVLFDRQRIFLLRWFLIFVIPAALLITFLTSTAILIGFPEKTSSNQEIQKHFNFTSNPTQNSQWFLLFVQVPTMMCIPFLPLMLPILLIILGAVGEAKVLSVTYCETITPQDAPLKTPTSLSSQALFFQSEENDWWKLLPMILWRSRGAIQPRNSGLFTALGSLTVLCCIDKEGILSWFNPSAEKVFFFQHEKMRKRAETIPEESNVQSSGDKSEGDESRNRELGNVPSLHESDKSWERMLTTETLTLSQDLRDPTNLQFDDVQWRDNISSLKPIGLDIYLNLCTCSLDPHSLSWSDTDSGHSLRNELFEKYTKKETHKDEYDDAWSSTKELQMSAIAHRANCDPPNINTARMGLCALCELIGFTQDGLRLTYSSEESFTAYRKPLCTLFRYHGSGETPKEDPERESVGSPLEGQVFVKKIRGGQCLPFLHGSVFKNLFGDNQLLVYGSGVLLAEQCHEVWDGQEILPMTNQDKKRVVDFYQRGSVTGQCVAFAFMPLLPNDSNERVEGKHRLIDLNKDKERKIIKVGSSETEVSGNLIFLGMATLQFQARYAVCQMVDTLDHACIRFVYFSTDNEVRSKVFAEKMGLETGWNCHISLSSTPESAQEARHQRSRHKSESSKSRSSLEAISQKMKTSFDEDDNEDTAPTGHLLDRLSPRTQSESSTSDSLFNMSNRAKLPRGIQNIVPHIENVDNVPLLVPLFTDATPETAGEMIRIMRSYGEVVCCIGSSDSIRNMSVFDQANVSLAIEPVILPKMASAPSPRFLQELPGGRLDSMRMRSTLKSADNSEVALATARNLQCFPCSLLLSGDDSLQYINAMIKQARHFLFLLRIFFIFLVKCQVMVVLYQLLSFIFLLPAPFTPVHLYWISFIIVPCLSLSLLGSPPDSDLMTWANQKTLPKDRPVTGFMMRQSCKRYLVKYLPSVIVLITCYAFCLHSSCLEIQSALVNHFNVRNDSMNSSNFSLLNSANDSWRSSIEIKCYPAFQVMMTINQSTVSLNLWAASAVLKSKRRTIQLVLSSVFVLYLCVISTGYVHRWRRLNDKPPYLNKIWCITLPIIVIVQVLGGIVVYLSMVPLQIESDPLSLVMNVAFSHPLDFGSYQVAIWVILLLWPVPLLIFNELWKWREIKMWNRSQKRARLDFGTKLGMNSPF